MIVQKKTGLFLLDNYANEEMTRYRFSRGNLQSIIDLVYDDLLRKTDRACVLSVLLQLVWDFWQLRDFARLWVMLLAFVSQLCARWYKIFCKTICRDIHGRDKNTYFRIPRNANKIESIRNIIFCYCLVAWGCWLHYCTHSKIMRPTENEADFVYRKGNHSINVQCIKDDFQGFIDVEARWPGSSHDSFLLVTLEVITFIKII